MFKTQENSPPSLTVAKLGTPTPAARCWVTTCCTAQIDTHILTWVCWLRLPTKPPERTINCCGEGFAATNCVLFDHDQGIPTVCRGIKTRLDGGRRPLWDAGSGVCFGLSHPRQAPCPGRGLGGSLVRALGVVKLTGSKAPRSARVFSQLSCAKARNFNPRICPCLRQL